MRRASHDDAERAGRSWDSFVLGRAADGDFAETITRLHAGDDTPHVDPAFVDRLGRQLLTEPAANILDGETMGRTTTLPPMRGASLNGHHPVSESKLRRPTTGRRPEFGAWFGVATVVIAIAVLVVTVIPGRTFGLFDDDSGPRNIAAPTFPGQDDVPFTGTVPYRGDAARTGVMPGPGPSGEPMLAWMNQEGLYHSNLPVIAGNRVFITRGAVDDSAYELVALDLRTGQELWTAPVDDGSRWTPAVADGLVVLPIGDDLVAIDAETGETVWRYPLGGRMNGVSPAIADGFVYFTVTDFSMRAVDAATGEEAWRIDIPGLTADEMQYEGFVSDSSVAVAGGVVYAVGNSGLVFAVDADDGGEIWIYRTEGGQPGTPLVVDGMLLVTSIVREEGEAGTPGRLTALDAETGTPVWGPIVLSSAATLTAGGGMVYVQVVVDDGVSVVGDQPASIEAYDLHTGEQRWTFEGGGFLDEPAYVDGDLYVSNRKDGTIQRIDAATGTPEWSVYLNAGDPVIADSLVIASGYGAVYAVAGNGEAGGADVASNPPDFSGLPACSPPRPAPTAAIEGTPVATIAVETRLIEPEGGWGTSVDGRPSRFTVWPQILAENIPTGSAASIDDILAIQETLRRMAPCSVRREGNRLVQGYFTDDFFRRGIATEVSDGYSMTWQYQPEEPEIDSLSAIVLDDGRIAATTYIAYNQEPMLLMIFVKQDGQWLIDELYRVVGDYADGPIG